MKPASFLCSFGGLLLISATGLPSAVGEVFTNRLVQSHFLLNPDLTNVCETVLYYDMSNNIVSPSSVAAPVLERVAEYCAISLPSFEMQSSVVSNVLPAILDMPNLSGPEGSIGIPIDPDDYTNEVIFAPWVAVLPVAVVTNVIDSEELTNISYLELVDRLAQFLNVKTGILLSGELVYGTDGNWVTNYLPAYTVELSVRYEQ